LKTRPIARILEPHGGEVVLAHPKKLRAICEAKVKTDKADARTLTELLAADLVPAPGRRIAVTRGCEHALV